MGKMQDEIKGLRRQNRHLENIVRVALDKERGVYVIGAMKKDPPLMD